MHILNNITNFREPGVLGYWLKMIDSMMKMKCKQLDLVTWWPSMSISPVTVHDEQSFSELNSNNSLCGVWECCSDTETDVWMNGEQWVEEVKGGPRAK